MATNRMAKLRARRTDPLIKAARALDEAIDSIREEDPIRYVVETMHPIDKEYTDNTYAEGDRIKNQLNKGLNPYEEKVVFRYQGSVTNDTHVRVHSDLDLLVIDTDFESIQPPGKVQSPYQGNPLGELKQLRAKCVSILMREFPAAKIDSTPSKCIAISGGSLRREIDVVIANWWNTIEYQQHQNEILRGVKVFDASLASRHENKPFLHNYRVDQRDQATSGNFRKICRFLKSAKYDADTKIEISSYDIVSIAWNMPDSCFAVSRGQEMSLVANARDYLKYILEDDAYRNSLKVPIGMRNIFGNGGAAKSQLLLLFYEVDELASQIESSLAKSYRKIQDAWVRY